MNRLGTILYKNGWMSEAAFAMIYRREQEPWIRLRVKGGVNRWSWQLLSNREVSSTQPATVRSVSRIWRGDEQDQAYPEDFYKRRIDTLVARLCSPRARRKGDRHVVKHD